MQKVQPLDIVISGRRFRLERRDVERDAGAFLPEPIRDHYAVVSGKRFPPKQLIAAVTGLDRADFTTNQARAILRRLGFATGRLSKTLEPAVAEAAAPYGSPEADELRPHIGKWVALKEGRVLVATATPREALEWLRAHGQRSDAFFRVPLDPSVDLGGFSA